MRDWNALSKFARNLGVKENKLKKAEQDFKEFLKRYSETLEFIFENHKSKLNESFSYQVFRLWDVNLYCFFELILSGYRHVAIRELRYYLESSARSYYIDSNHHKMTYNCKKSILKEVRRRRFRDLIQSLKKKQKELEKYYSKLCDYVHLSEETQTDATKDPDLNLALGLRFYEKDIKLLRKTFEYSCYLLVESLE